GHDDRLLLMLQQLGNIGGLLEAVQANFHQVTLGAGIEQIDQREPPRFLCDGDADHGPLGAEGVGRKQSLDNVTDRERKTSEYYPPTVGIASVWGQPTRRNSHSLPPRFEGTITAKRRRAMSILTRKTDEKGRLT